MSKLDELLKEIESNPRDQRLHQKLGELHQKRGDSGQAARAFKRVAELYADDGFFLRAVALAKQVLKLDPKLIEAEVLLAEWHHALQLTGEAREHLILALRALNAEGRTAEARVLEARFAAAGLSRLPSTDEVFLASPKARA
ncbi:MAG: hypothetical protein Q8N23_02115 [Archangium sp.]|nr:hypothetical protein [Archangium sp.]MDP3575327.1 hypothetical protein [Archangium sp.]